MDTEPAMGTALNASAALVSFSGGQDSTTALAWALNRYEIVETVGFRYGQKYLVEMDCRPVIREAIANLIPIWKKRLGPDYIVELDLVGQIAAKNFPPPTDRPQASGERFTAGGALHSGTQPYHAVYVRKRRVSTQHKHAGLWNERNGIFRIS
jgi:Queuosine biosynthesis protein QueC